MIRLTVKELYQLQDAIQASGEVNATVMPKDAFSSQDLFVAWARSIEGKELFLALWKDEDSWKREKSPLLVDIFSNSSNAEEKIPMIGVNNAEVHDDA